MPSIYASPGHRLHEPACEQLGQTVKSRSRIDRTSWSCGEFVQISRNFWLRMFPLGSGTGRMGRLLRTAKRSKSYCLNVPLKRNGVEWPHVCCLAEAARKPRAGAIGTRPLPTPPDAQTSRKNLLPKSCVIGGSGIVRLGLSSAPSRPKHETLWEAQSLTT